MTITINAHQLCRLIDQTASHIGGEYSEQLHGVRFDADSRYLYAIGTDRFTLAVARYKLREDETDQEPFACTIPGASLPALREWASSMKGAEWVTIDTFKERLVFEGPRTGYSIAVDTGEFPDWRGVLRTAVDQTVGEDLFPAFNSEMLQRFGETGHILRVRVTADRKPAVFVGVDFLGAQMPVRPSVQAAAGQDEQESFASTYNSWYWTLAAGSKGAEMADLPAEERPRYEATTDVPETVEDLLKSVLRSTSNAFDTSHFDEDREAFHAFIHAGVANWMAYRYLDALHQVDPRAAQAVVADTAGELDSGELGEFAWDTAKGAGHDPQKWQDDYYAALRKRAEEQPSPWALRLAAGLNAARNAGITFTVADNPHVRFDEADAVWVAVKPELAAAEATS